MSAYRSQSVWNRNNSPRQWLVNHLCYDGICFAVVVSSCATNESTAKLWLSSNLRLGQSFPPSVLHSSTISNLLPPLLSFHSDCAVSTGVPHTSTSKKQWGPIPVCRGADAPLVSPQVWTEMIIGPECERYLWNNPVCWWYGKIRKVFFWKIVEFGLILLFRVIMLQESFRMPDFYVNCALTCFHRELRKKEGTGLMKPAVALCAHSSSIQSERTREHGKSRESVRNLLKIWRANCSLCVREGTKLTDFRMRDDQTSYTAPYYCKF